MRLAACDTGKNRYSRMLRNGGDNFTDTARNDGMSSPGDTRPRGNPGMTLKY